MPEGIDQAADVFARAIDPAPTANEQPAQRQPATRARDTDNGRFAAVADKPEPFLEIRMLEGDPETGDTSDAGDDPRLRQREREVADGRVDERAERQAAENRADERRDAAAPTGDELPADDEPGDEEADAAGDEADEEAQYEITVDGAPTVVSLGELRDGYIRTATFHSRLNKVNEHKQAVDLENRRVSEMRDLYINGLTALDQDLQQLSPAEPDWDREYERDPLSARRKQKEYQAYNNKLAQIRANRAWAIQNGREEHDRQSARYAIEQFTQFVEDHKRVIKDEPSLQRVVGGMRKTALAEGFNEVEVAGVYDKRMLNILFKAWMYDQGMAVRPQAVLPGQGKALAPGSARPVSGSAGRRNVDEASKQLARTGKMEDATVFFQRFLR